jgi:spore maturation protein CgeB
VRIVYAVENHYWEDMNLLDGLRQVGHEVVVHRPGYPFHQALSPSWTAGDRQRVSERLVDAVRREHQRRPVDVLFGYLLNQLVYPEAIREISDMGILTMNYWCNGAHQFYLVDEISPAFDVCIVTERAALPSYEAVGAHAVYLQMAANPERYRPYALPVEYDVTFVGQRYADRPELVLYLLQQGIDVRVWGPGWTPDREYGEKDVGLALTPGFVLRHPRAAVLRTAAHLRSRVRRRKTISPDAERRLARVAGPSLPYEELIRMYSRSRISLGFSTTGDARYDDPVKIRQIHLRDFEAPMSGAAYFVEFQEELTEFYNVDREIVCYSSREELAEKVGYYLDRPDEVRRLRRAGHERARRDHTWARRFQDLFSRVVV